MLKLPEGKHFQVESEHPTQYAVLQVLQAAPFSSSASLSQYNDLVGTSLYDLSSLVSLLLCC
jgi:hypothetical protein